jgi:hypothetical protein
MAVVYSIRDWNKAFEIAQSRKRRTPSAWVATPTKHDGKSFRRLMLMEGGVELYGAWMLIVQVAAKCPIRGVLADSDGPLDTSDLAIKTGCPEVVFEKALKALAEPKIGWIVVEEWEGGGIMLPLHTDNTEQDQPTNQPDTPPNGEGMAGGLAGGFSLEMTWEAVAQRLAALEVVQWPQAIDAAKAAGCFPRVAHQLIDHAERYGYGPGAIAKRFAIASPTLGINTGWPNTERSESSEQKRVQKAADRRSQRATADLESECWLRVKAGRAAGRTDEQIKAETDALGLPWVNPAKPSTNGKAVCK